MCGGGLFLQLWVFTLRISNLGRTFLQALGRIPDEGRVKFGPGLPNLGLERWLGFGLGVCHDLQW